MPATKDTGHPEAVDAARQVIVEAVHGIGPFVMLHDSAYLKVGERTADGHESRSFLVQLHPVSLPESHDVIGALGEIDVLDGHRVLMSSHIDNPCSRRGVTAGSLALELVIPPDLIANHLIVASHPVRECQVIVLEVLGLVILQPDDERGERPDGVLGESPWKHVVHAVLQVLSQRLHVIAGRIKGFLLVPHFLQILAVGSLFHGLVSKSGHHMSGLFPLVLSRIIEGTEVLDDETDDITATTTVMTEI